MDMAEADAILESLPEHCRLCQDVLVSYLRHREFPFSVSTTGRVFNAITGLKRELRHALRIGSERLESVDIACAQPALLCLEMAHESPAYGLKGYATYKHMGDSSCLLSSAPDPSLLSTDAFRSLVLDGLLYEHLMELTGLSRDLIKRCFLRDVLAKRGCYPSPVENAFRASFPGVYTIIRAVNRQNHGELIRQLQRLESWLVVELVAPRLVGRVPVITLHDAIYSTHGSLSAVEDAFNEVFDTMDFRPTLKREASPLRQTCNETSTEVASARPKCAASRH